MFGVIEEATIKNIGIGSNSIVIGSDGVAGIVGYIYNKSSVENCYNKAKVKGTENVGGLVGNAYVNSSITNSYNEGSVSASSYSCGGVVGFSSESEIMNSYNTGIIEGKYEVGGIVGTNEGKVLRCFNNGLITGLKAVGGIAGGNGSKNYVDIGENGGIIECCYNTKRITTTVTSGNSNVGGIAGWNHKYIKYCYSNGEISSGTSYGRGTIARSPC